jgi:hypothetical protein
LRVLKFASEYGLSLAHVGAAVAAGHAEIDEELGDGLGRHRRAPIGVEGELVTGDTVAGERVGDERFGEFAGLGGGDHPPDDVAAEDVDDHEQLVVDAPLGALELGVGVGPGRPAGFSTGGFPRPALRTGYGEFRVTGCMFSAWLC